MLERQAEWTLNSATEREIVRSRREMVFRHTATVMFFISAGFAVTATISEVLAIFEPIRTSLTAIIQFLPALLFLGIGLLALRRAKKIARIDRQRRDALREDAPVDGWTVELFVLQGNAPTGRDRGVVWFEDQKLFFNGERTSFGLARNQARTLDRLIKPVVHVRPAYVLLLDATTTAGVVSVGFNLSPDNPKAVQDAYYSFNAEFRAWLESSHTRTGQLPPLAIGPGILKRSDLLRAALFANLTWPTLFLAAIAVGLITDWSALIAPGLALAVLLPLFDHLWHPRILWLAWRDRKRLDEASQ